MFHRFYHAPNLALLMLAGFSLLLSACMPASTLRLAVPSGGVQVPAHSPTVTTNCPTAGTVRRAIMPPLTLGQDASILYVYELDLPALSKYIIRRYDTVTGRTTDVLTTTDGISAPQLSSDGQWVLFISNVGKENALQLLRVDGHYRQTLFCVDPTKSIDGMIWSPDQKRVLVNLDIAAGSNSQPPNPLEIALLDLGSSRFQTVLTQPEDVAPIAWINNTTVLLNGAGTGPGDYGFAPLILDLSKGLPQQARTLQQLVPSFVCGDLAPGANGDTVLIAECDGPDGTYATGTDTIRIQPINAGSARAILGEKNIDFAGIRPLSSTALIFLIYNQDGDLSMNGLWKVNLDGTHVTHLFTDSRQNISGQFGGPGSIWSSVSRDGRMYSLLQTDMPHQPVKFTLLFGSLDGGTPIPFASVSSNQTSLSIIGWTTM